jgi:hypothetical protein
LIYWKDCSAERDQFDSDEPGPWNFHYHTRQRRLFNEIKKGENIWVVVFDTKPPPGDWLLIEKLSVKEKRHIPEFARSYQVIGDPKNSVFFDIRKQSDLTPLLHKLSFVTGKKIVASGAKIAQSLQSIRSLTSEDSALLQSYAQRLPKAHKLSEIIPGD